MSFLRFRRRFLELAPRRGRWHAWVLFETVDSTNSLARRVASAFGELGRRPPATVFVAYHQSRGRGRGSNSWVSPAGQGVYASFLIPEVAPAHLHSLPLLAAVGLARGIAPLVEGPVGLRWPNDLVICDGEGEGERVRREKLGGILIESMGRPGEPAVVVVGFGVNHGVPEDGPPAVGATSILLERPTADAGRQEREPAAGLADVAARLLAAVDVEMDHLGDEVYAAETYAAASVHRRGDALSCREPGGRVDGVFRGFDRRGFLRLDTPAGERLLSAGELVTGGSDEEETK